MALEKGKNVLEKDPNDKLYYAANIGADLANSSTTAASVIAVAEGVEVLEGPEIQGNVIIVKLGGMGTGITDSFCTFRVTCANSEQFDRTIYFRPVEN